MSSKKRLVRISCTVPEDVVAAADSLAEAEQRSHVGYYGTARGGTPEHTPQACYAAHGWEILDERAVLIDADTGQRAVEYLVESRGQRQLVLFWYRSYRGSGFGSILALQVDHILGKLRDGRGDGALVRLSTPLIGVDRDAARGMVIGFAREIERASGRGLADGGASTPGDTAVRDGFVGCGSRRGTGRASSAR